MIQFHFFPLTLYVDEESAFESCSADQQVQFCLSCYTECIFYYYLSWSFSRGRERNRREGEET